MDHYTNFISNKLFLEDYNFTNEDITLMFNLHNHQVNPLNPEYSKSCAPCVKRIINACRAHFKDYNVVKEVEVIVVVDSEIKAVELTVNEELPTVKKKKR